MITFACACGKSLKVADERAGKKVKCPGCGAVVTAGAQPAPARAAHETASDHDHPERQETQDLPRGAGKAAAGLRPAQQAGELGRLGPYRVLQVLGEGGMGRVYLAEDPKLKRRIALKVMHAELAVDAKARQRFLREAQAQAAIEHDHIIAIFAVDEDNGVPYLAMPLLKGETLAEHLKRTREMALAEVLRIGREIAEGLAAAHAEGLIHRDIKPGNIWLEGERRRVKILDFGLARAVASSDQQHLTRTGAIIGTPAYMSPEQAEGVKLDGRSDLFSLGCVLYQLATGELPFQGPTTVAVLTALALKEPKAPRERNPELPPELNDLILQMLAKKASDRPAGAAEVAQALETIAVKYAGVAATQTIATRPAGAVARATDAAIAPATRLAVGRRRGLWLGGAVAVLLAGIVLFWQTPQGLVRIESDDPNIEIVFDRTGPTIKGADRTPIVLQAGEHGMLVKRGEFAFSTDKLLVKKGETLALKVEVLAGKMQLVHEGKVLGAVVLPATKEFKNSLGMEFVLVPQGSFFKGGGAGQVGSKVVDIPYDFYLGKYEVTQAEWEEVMKTQPSAFSRSGSERNKVVAVDERDLRRFPVESVSWDDAQEFILRLNKRVKEEAGWRYRLPTEAEWEYACRGGPSEDKRDYGFDYYFEKPTNTLTPDRANYKDSKLGRTCKVGSYEGNWLGLHDMHGNVREWCEDEAPPDPKDPKGASRRVARGGIWNDGSGGCRAAYRNVNPPADRDFYRGLRLARVPVGGGTGNEKK